MEVLIEAYFKVIIKKNYICKKRNPFNFLAVANTQDPIIY